MQAEGVVELGHQVGGHAADDETEAFHRNRADLFSLEFSNHRRSFLERGEEDLKGNSRAVLLATGPPSGTPRSQAQLLAAPSRVMRHRHRNGSALAQMRDVWITQASAATTRAL